MAGKKNYIDVVNSDWTNGVNARDLFVRLNSMTPDERQTRIGEIGKAIEEIDKEISKIARKARRSQRAGASKEELEASQQERDDLTDMQIQLEDERDMLELFTRVQAVVSTIDAVRTDMKAKSASQSIQIQEAEREFKEAEEQEKEAKAKLDRAKEIDEEIEEKKKEIAALDGKRPKVMVAIQEEIDELGEEKEGLISKEEYAKIKTTLITKRSDVGKLKAKRAKTEKALELCENPWDGILKGYEWEDVAELSDADLSSMLGVKVEIGIVDRDKDKDGDKDKGKGKGDEGRGGSRGGFGGGPIQPTPPTPPAPEAEIEEEPEEAEEETGDGEEEKGWIARKIEGWRASREAKKEAKEAFIEEFRLTRGRKPSWWERFKAKHPKIFKTKEPIISKKTPEQLKAEAIAAKQRTQEEIEAAKAIIEKNRTVGAQVRGRLEEIEATRLEEEKKVDELKIQLGEMSSEEIIQMKPLYADMLSEDVFNTMYARAVMREAKEAKKAGKEKAEKAAKASGASKNNTSSARAAHRAFARDLGGTSSTAVQNASKANEGATQASGKSAPSAPAVAPSAPSGVAGHDEK